MRLFVLLMLCCGEVLAADCPVQDIALGATAQGSLSTTDCRLRDIDATQRTATYVNQYRATLTTAGVFTASMSSSVFNTYLYLYDGAGKLLAANDDADGGTDSRITISLPAGKYTVVASSRTAATGAYTLKVAFELPRPCPITDLAAGSPVSGALSASTCRPVDFAALSTDARPLDRYRISVEKGSVLTIDLTSGDFDTYVEIYSSSGGRLGRNHDGGGGNNSRLLISVRPGTYLIYAFAFTAGSGSYTLTVNGEAPRTCPVKDIQLGDPLLGTLSTDSCRILDLIAPSTDATYTDIYRFTANARTVVKLDMNSPAFDTYLVLTNSNYVAIQDANENTFENDDADDFTSDSEILGSIPAGTYYLLANTSKVETGSYTGLTRSEAPRSCPPKDLRTSDSVTGTLLSTSCRVLDLITPSMDYTLLDQYRVVIDKPGVLTLDMTSFDFSPYLFVVDQAYSSRYELDSFGDSNIAVDLLVTPGTYFVFANTDDYSGAYTLKTKFRDPRVCPAETIGSQEEKAGQLTAGGCTFQDIVPFTDTPLPTARYQLNLGQDSDLQVTVSSAEFPPVLVIADGKLEQLLALDVNTGDNGSATVTGRFAAGSYNLLVSSLAGNPGAFTVRTSVAGAASQ